MSCAETTGGPGQTIGEGPPLQQINTRACDHDCQDDETVPEGWKEEGEQDEDVDSSWVEEPGSQFTEQNVPKGWKMISDESPGGSCHQYIW